MRDYKGWTAKERRASLKKTKAAIAAGIIPPPTKCNRCGKETGRIDYHNHDYSDPIKYLEPLCQGCHTRLHRRENKEMDAKSSNVTNTESVPENSSNKESKADVSVVDPVNTTSENAGLDLNRWLEIGMNLPVKDLADHVRSTPVGVKPLHALRGLGIVFCNGFTKLYNCKDYPRDADNRKGKDWQKYQIVLERIKYHEKNGESLKVKGMPLSEKLESNYNNN